MRYPLKILMVGPGGSDPDIVHPEVSDLEEELEESRARA